MIEVRANTNIEKIRIKNEHDEEIGVLTFYPSDLNLPARLDKGKEEIASILQDAEKKAQDMEKDEFLTEVEVIDGKLKEQLNYMFNTDISSVFGETNLLTPTADGYLVEVIMDAILPAIKECVEKAAEMVEKKKNKYLGAYK